MHIVAGLDDVITIRRVFGVRLKRGAGADRNRSHQRNRVFCQGSNDPLASSQPESKSHSADGGSNTAERLMPVGAVFDTVIPECSTPGGVRGGPRINAIRSQTLHPSFLFERCLVIRYSP